MSHMLHNARKNVVWTRGPTYVGHGRGLMLLIVLAVPCFPKAIFTTTYF